jgi:hypothetical protein
LSTNVGLPLPLNLPPELVNTWHVAIQGKIIAFTFAVATGTGLRRYKLAKGWCFSAPGQPLLNVLPPFIFDLGSQILRIQHLVNGMLLTSWLRSPLSARGSA